MQTTNSIVPSGLLKKLKVAEIKPSMNNPRQLFDPGPLGDLKESIKKHGVLVPITVYKLKGQNLYAILDGERRYRCCVDLEKEGMKITIPSNIVEPPTKIASLLYMFSIHNFREQWELMPTALSLKEVISELGEQDNKKISELTGLSETQVERCKILLEFSEKYQNMSLDPNPKTRIPSNFWIEAYPVIKIYRNDLSKLVQRKGEEAIIDALIDKYWDKEIVSVIHFRRIREAYDRACEESPDQKLQVIKKLEEFINEPKLEIRAAFDRFLPSRDVSSILKLSQDFTDRLKKLKLEYDTENKDRLIKSLHDVKKYLNKILEQLEGSDPPPK